MVPQHLKHLAISRPPAAVRRERAKVVEEAGCEESGGVVEEGGEVGDGCRSVIMDDLSLKSTKITNL